MHSIRNKRGYWFSQLSLDIVPTNLRVLMVLKGQLGIVTRELRLVKGLNETFQMK